MKHYISLLIGTLLIMAVPNLQAGDFINLTTNSVGDKKTGLIWMKATALITDWESAIISCEGSTLDGFDDWRLPNIKELKSVADVTKYDPSIDTVFFPGTTAVEYWSSTTYISNTLSAWAVSFLRGYHGVKSKTSSLYVRCVRSGQ